MIAGCDGALCASHIFGVLRLSIGSLSEGFVGERAKALPIIFVMSRCFRRQANMSSRFHQITRAAALSAILTLGSQVFSTPAFPQYSAQSDDGDPEMRIQQLENQLRQLTGQNEELQHQNQQLQERLRSLQGGAQPAPGGGQPGIIQPGTAALPPPQPNPAYRQPAGQPGYDQPQIAAPAPIYQEEVPAQGGRRRGDAFDPSQNPNAPGVPRALGGGQLPVATGAPVGAPGGRAAGEPLSLESPSQRDAAGALPPQRGAGPNAGSGLTTLPPSATPRDEFDLGIGYMQRKDYALAAETMRNFAQKYPTDPMVADSQYWLGESFFQRQQYRDAAEAFLAVTTKFDKSAKAPDALLRLGQSLAALKEKEAACAAFGEVMRKYPRASSGVKAAVDREQKRVKC
jgi:tol-pal system protein YbgF